MYRTCYGGQNVVREVLYYLLQPVGWEGQSIPIYTNDTVALGGFSDKHIIPLFLIILTVLFLAPCLIKKLMIYG